MKRFILLGLIYSYTALQAQNVKPKLIVGVVVDQMRYDYLYKYYDKYSEGGFKRLMNEGTLCKNAHYNYVPTYTAPGHSSIYTGTTPAVHGIAGNEWYDRNERRTVYCTIDSMNPKTNPVGTTNKKIAAHSAARQLTTTLSDELRMFTGYNGKVISIALKDRSAILPAGHNANGAYWFNNESGGFVSSTYYVKEMPDWMLKFNNRKLADEYLSKPWETLLPIQTYTESASDNNAYEGTFKGETAPVFPHDLPALRKKGDYSLLRDVPFGNTFTLEAAKAAIEGEALGADDITDLLAISLSPPDHIGHKYGPQSIEVEDCYLRLDRELADFITHLDKQVGKGNYHLFLTADHGAAQNPTYMTDYNLPGGYFKTEILEDSLRTMLNTRYGKADWLLDIHNNQVFLNRALMHARKLNPDDVEDIVARWLENQEHIFKAIPAHTLRSGCAQSKIERLVQNGLHPFRSGDVAIVHSFGSMEWEKTGTTHGTSFSYDTHIPILFYGFGVKAGVHMQHADITDIAPTVAAICNIPFPGAASGKVLEIK